MHSLDTDIQGFTEYPVEHDVYSAGSYTCTLYVQYIFKPGNLIFSRNNNPLPHEVLL